MKDYPGLCHVWVMYVAFSTQRFPLTASEYLTKYCISVQETRQQVQVEDQGAINHAAQVREVALHICFHTWERETSQKTRDGEAERT